MAVLTQTRTILVLFGLALAAPAAAEAPAAAGSPASGAAGAVETKVPALTPEEAAEREGRKACKVAICAAFRARQSGGDIACDVLKTWRKEQLEKMVAKAKVSWPWGQVQCTASLKLGRDMLAKAGGEAKYEADLGSQKVACKIDRDKEPAADITLAFSPKVSFENGKAVKAAINWGKLEAPTLVKGALWTATATDNTLNVLQGTLVEDINDFFSTKCDEVRADWDAK
jgi:hypothetical protein